MTDPTSLVPISDEQAKAAQEAFKAFQEAVKALVGAGKFLRETFGTVPEDVVALLGGNWLKVRRAEQLAGMLAKTEERLHARRVEGHEPSLSIALPIFVAAADENREELQDIWARLLAAAADPARAKSFRLAFIETAKKMDPLDAAVLQGIHAVGGAVTGQNRNALADQLHATRDEIDVSVANLIKLELVYSSRPESTAVAAGISAPQIRMGAPLILKRASASRPSGGWNDDDFDVLADGAVVGRILKVHAAPVGSPWMWTLAFGHHEDRMPMHDYAATREAAMAAFAKSWRRE